MHTQLSFKPARKKSKSSRPLNSTSKKKFAFQKLKVEFISKPKKRSRTEFKDSPVLFDSQDYEFAEPQKICRSKLDVKFNKSNANVLLCPENFNFPISRKIKSHVDAKVCTESSGLPASKKIKSNVGAKSCAKNSSLPASKKIKSNIDAKSRAKNSSIPTSKKVKSNVDAKSCAKNSSIPASKKMKSQKLKSPISLKSKVGKKVSKVTLKKNNGDILPENFRNSRIRAPKKAKIEESKPPNKPRSRNNKGATKIIQRSKNILNKNLEIRQTRKQTKLEKLGTSKVSSKKKVRGSSKNNEKECKPLKTISDSKGTTFYGNNGILSLNCDAAKQSGWRTSNAKKPVESSLKASRHSIRTLERDLCSLFNSCSIRNPHEICGPPVKIRRESFFQRQSMNVCSSELSHCTPPDSFGSDESFHKNEMNLIDTSSADELLSEFSNIFSMQLNFGNYSENLDVMSLLSQVKRIENKLPHFVPLSENWYEDFDSW